MIKTIYGFTFEALEIGQTSYSITLIDNKRQFVWKSQLQKVNLCVYAVPRYFRIQIRPLVASAGINFKKKKQTKKQMMNALSHIRLNGYFAGGWQGVQLSVSIRL